VYAIELARRLGVEEVSQIRAIEAAALLHDMGKLAIPETILNKPGRLSTAEYDKMKAHASIGADLLSPSVPLSGGADCQTPPRALGRQRYPAGIAKTDIPLGARILSVVDCFDALTSDRPYRPAMTDAEAFAVLHERRGTMYDPMVVDAFVTYHAEIPHRHRGGGTGPEPHQARLFRRRRTGRCGRPLQQIRANALERHSYSRRPGPLHTAPRPLRPLTACAVCARADPATSVRCSELASGRMPWIATSLPEMAQSS